MDKLVVFDFDGTLADSGQVMTECANQLAPRYGYEEIEDWRMFRHMSMREVLKQHAKIPWYRLPFFIRNMKRAFEKEVTRVNLFPGIKEMLNELVGELDAGVLTSNQPVVVENLFVRNLVNGLRFVVGDVPLFAKTRALKKLVARHKQKALIYVGDEVRDVEACNALGIPIVAVTWGLNTRELLEKAGANYLVDTPKELLQVLTKGL